MLTLVAWSTPRSRAYARADGAADARKPISCCKYQSAGRSGRREHRAGADPNLFMPDPTGMQALALVAKPRPLSSPQAEAAARRHGPACVPSSLAGALM